MARGAIRLNNELNGSAALGAVFDGLHGKLWILHLSDLPEATKRFMGKPESRIVVTGRSTCGPKNNQGKYFQESFHVVYSMSGLGAFQNLAAVAITALIGKSIDPSLWQ